MWMVKNLLAKIPGYQGSECTGGSVAKDFQVTDFLCDNVQLLAGAETLYLRAEDLAKGHVSEVKGGPVGDDYTAAYAGQEVFDT